LANVKISALTAVTAPATTDVVPIVNAGVTKKVTIENLVLSAMGTVPGCRLQNAGNQSMTTAVALILNWDTENWDTGTMHDLSTNPSRITIARTGKYIVEALVLIEGPSTTGIRQLAILKNGANVGYNYGIPIASGCTIQLMTILDLVATDYLQVQVYQNSGGALAAIGTTAAATGLAIPQFGAILIG
jgi:hypothetical protein